MSRSLLRLVPALLTAAVLAAGCAQPATSTFASAQSTPDNFSRAKAAGIRPVAIGTFTSAQDKLPTEARYLRDTLDVELQGAGLVNPSSTAVIDGQVTAAEFAATTGTVAARFTVTVSGRVVYDRELRTGSTWDKSADAGRQQGAVYNKLVGVLLADPGFKNAVPR
jgi:hypothetical protein